MKSISFFTTVRVNRSNSAAASVLIVFLSGVSGVPFNDLGELPPKLVFGDPVFLCNNELKKVANTPSLPAPPGFNFPSI